MLHFPLRLARLAFSRTPPPHNPCPRTPPTCLCPLSPLAWLQLKGKCSSGEVHYLHHKVLWPIMLPGRPAVSPPPPPPLVVSAFSSQNVYLFLSTSLTSSSEWGNEPLWASPRRVVSPSLLHNTSDNAKNQCVDIYYKNVSIKHFKINVKNILDCLFSQKTELRT